MKTNQGKTVFLMHEKQKRKIGLKIPKLLSKKKQKHTLMFILLPAKELRKIFNKRDLEVYRFFFYKNSKYFYKLIH